MSLIKQLWLGMIFLLLFALGGSFIMSLKSAKEYLQHQLHIKNIDDANSLALSISQMEKDSIDIELIITAQFDAGHYEYIMFNDQHKKPIAVRRFENTQIDAPNWFVNWVNLDAAPGIALIQDGWQQYGNIIVKSHSSFAIESLWKQAMHLLEWFFISVLLSFLLAIIAFRNIKKPLHQLIEQAESISHKRFITSVEPRTTEFKRLAKAMNQLSNDVKNMLEKESIQLNALRHESLLDPLTKLENRQHFLNNMNKLLFSESAETQGVIIICRILNLQEINNLYGRNQTDDIIKEVAQAFYYLSQQYPLSHAGRLNGTDFAIIVPSIEPMDHIATDLVQRLNFQLISHAQQHLATPIAATQYQKGNDRQQLLHLLDGALAQAELKGDHAVIACLKDKNPTHHRNLSDWREEITTAIESNQFFLGKFPVCNSKNELLHSEAPLRMKTNGHDKTAGDFIPWAARLNLLATIDITVIKLAIHQLSTDRTPLAVHLSSDTVSNYRFREELISLIKHNRDYAELLWVEFPEITIIRHPDALKSLLSELRNLGCKIGLEHVGLEFIQFEKLQDVGLHYLKIDSAIIRDIDTNTNNHAFVQSLCQLGHSLGITMIGEGVATENEKSTLIKIGVDAFTGPLIC